MPSGKQGDAETKPGPLHPGCHQDVGYCPIPSCHGHPAAADNHHCPICGVLGWWFGIFFAEDAPN